ADGDEASDEDDDSSDTEDEDSSDDEGTADGEDPTGAAGAGVGGGAAVGAGAAGTAAAVDVEESEDGEDSAAGGGTSAGAAVAASAATGSAAASAGGSSSRRRRLLTSIVAVAAVLALVAWLVIANLPEPTSIVPGQLAGKQVEEVTSQLQDSDLKAEPKEVFDDSVPAGQVIGTEPVSGSELAPEPTVTVVGAAREVKCAVAEVEGLSADGAQAARKEAHLAVGEVEQEYSETVDSDAVISASEEPGKKLPEGEKIDLVVSRGVAPIP